MYWWIRILKDTREIAYYACRAKNRKEAERTAKNDCYWYDGDKWEVFKA